MITFQNEIYSFINNQFAQPDVSTVLDKPLRQIDVMSAYSHINEKPLYGLTQKNVQVHLTQPIQLIQAIQSSAKAWTDWKNSLLSQRIELIENIMSFIELNQFHFALAEAFDEALTSDFVLKANVAVALKKLTTIKNELQQASDTHLSLDQSIGVFGVILPNQFVLRLFVDHVVRPLCAGNAVVVKLSTGSPQVGFLLSQMIKKLNLPEGLLQILYNNTSSFNQLFVSHPGMKALTFVGSMSESIAVIKYLTPHLSNQFKKIQIHSSAKNSAIVIGEISELQMEDVFESFVYGQGQLHWNNSKLFILESELQKWSHFLNEKLAQQTEMATNPYSKSWWTPLRAENEVFKHDEIRLIAQSDHAKLIQKQTTMNNRSSHFVNAFFTQDMSKCSTLQQEPIYSPAYVLFSLKYSFDIPKIHNVSYLGFSTDIWGAEDKVKKIRSQLDSGLISYQKWSIYDENVQIGLKQSFWGNPDCRLSGSYYSHHKTIIN